jgi:hypothetical protein
MAGYGMDRANAARDQLYEATEAEGIGYGPKTQKIAKQMAESYNPIGITTWHGSPHIFQKFDMSKLGTGEGAQVYGSGMYTAENPLVAKGYQESLAGKAFNLKPETERLGLDLPISARGEFMRQAQAKLPPEKLAKNLQNANIESRDLPVDKLTELFKTYQEKSGGNMYKVDVPDTHIRRMLDWDAPIKDQPVIVRNLAKSLGIDMNDLGGDLLAKVGKDEAGRKVMQDAGIRGVKYLDEKSRFSPHEVSIAVKGTPYATNQFLTKEQADKYIAEKKAEGFDATYKNVGTKNFVVFDPNHMAILERNNQAIK